VNNGRRNATTTASTTTTATTALLLPYVTVVGMGEGVETRRIAELESLSYIGVMQ